MEFDFFLKDKQGWHFLSICNPATFYTSSLLGYWRGDDLMGEFVIYEIFYFNIKRRK